MRQLDRFTHESFREGGNLHDRLNKMVDVTNENLSAHDAAIDAANTTIASQGKLIADLLKRVKALES